MMAWRLEGQAIALAPQQRHLAVGQLHRVRQEHDRRFEPLGAVHGQDPNLVVLSFAEIALHLDVAGHQPVQKALQGRYMLALVGERQGEEFVDRIGRLGAEPLQHRPSPVFGSQDLGIEFEGRHVIGAGE